MLGAGFFAGAQGRVSFDEGWRFFPGDDSLALTPGYVEDSWRQVDLPHDWSIEGAFNEKNSSGQGEGGLPTGVGWYRKTFSVRDLADRKVYIDFDGVYRNSTVWINGHYLGRRPNGYISFRYELTPWLHTGGGNVIAVRVDNSAQPNSRWYSGSGIYRHVWLETKGVDAIGQWGVFVTTPVAERSRSVVRVNIKLAAPAKAGEKIRLLLWDSAGRIAASGGGALTAGDSVVQRELSFKNVSLWSPVRPYLYRLEVRLEGGKTLLDKDDVMVGVRKFRFDMMHGFFLNDHLLKIWGVCLHHDEGALGAAVNTAAIRRQLKLLKEMGCNAIRTSHNPPAPELLDLCDRMGFLVMDEAFDMWLKKKTKNDYSKDFAEWHERDLSDQIRRDRNHPSVILWSIGNEIREQFDSSGMTIAPELREIVRCWDTTRPITSALTEMDTTKNFIWRSGALDVMGLNYNQGKYDSVPILFPGRPFIGSETMSALATRGHYDMPSDSMRHWPVSSKEKYATGNPDYTVSAYDNVSAYWGSSHEETLKEAKKYPWVSGIFVWSGFDFIGEPVPYPWPARSSYYGIIDLAGFPKDSYWLYQSEWTAKPVLHLFPDWNGHTGEVKDVWVYYSQADEVELYLNDSSLGVRRKEGDAMHVWWRVNWRPGVLKAVSRKAGKVVLTEKVETSGDAARIQLAADRRVMSGDGKDLVFVTIRITDAAGRFVSDAADAVRVDVSGAGRLAAMDNGYQADLSGFHANPHKTYNGLCLAVIQAQKKSGEVLVRVSGQGLQPAVLKLECR